MPVDAIGFLGGVPAALGGGGLELQRSRTAVALRELGLPVVDLEAAPADAQFGIVHAFGAEPGTWQTISHWTRNRCPLVLSPVIVIGPGRAEYAQRASARLPAIWTSARMRRDLLLRADAVVALTEYESGIVRRLGVPEERVHVIPNGVDRMEPAPAGSLDLPSSPYAALVGTVSARKRQRETLEALAGHVDMVVVGGFQGSDEERRRWDQTVKATGATWLGPLSDPAAVRRVLHDATALVHLSSAEGQSLAVLEALAVGTPVVVSDIPSHRELARAHPGHVHLVSDSRDAAVSLQQLSSSPPPAQPQPVPAWADVAEKLRGVYSSLVR